MNVYDTVSENLGKNELKKEIRKCSNRNSMLILIFEVMVMGFGFIILPSVFKLMDLDVSAETQNSIKKLAVFVWQFLITIPIVLIIGNRNTDHKVKSYFCKPEASPRFILKWICITMGLAYTTNVIFTIIFSLIQKLTGAEFGEIGIIADDNIFDRIVMFIAIAILAPIFEELMFRGTLLSHTVKYGRWFSIIVIGCTFGLVHENYQQIFYAAVMGITVCFLVVKTKSIITSIIVHFSINLIGAIQSMFLAGINTEKLKNNSELFDYVLNNMDVFIPLAIIGIVYFSISVTGLILFIIEIVKHKETFKLENNCPQLSGKEKVSSYLTAPLTIITLIIIIILSIVNSMSAESYQRLKEQIFSFL